MATTWLFSSILLRRWVVGVVVLALLTPVLQGCAGKPAPHEIRLAGIVVDGQRVAGHDEAGLVRIVRGGAVIDGRAGMVLFRGDRVEAGPRVHLAIHYPTGTELLMRPGSSGQVGSFVDAVGEFFAKVRGTFAIETEFVRAGARGTAFQVRTGLGGETTVLVLEGQVLCESRMQAWQSLMLRRGEMATAHPRPAVMQQAPASELQRTRDWVERIERLVPPPGSGAGAQTAALAVGALVVAILASRNRGGDNPGPANIDHPSAPTGTPAQPAPVSLTAPLPTRPGDPSAARAGTLDCRSPVEFAWGRVANATDYVVNVEHLPLGSRRANWQHATDATSADVLARIRLDDGVYRWSVYARSGSAKGPTSGLRYFNCTTTVLR